MKIIEFCGCPGCGKSTICDILEMHLKEAGLKVVNLQKRQKCDTFWKKIKKIIRIISYKNYDPNKRIKQVLYAVNSDHKWADRILEAKWLLDRYSEYDYVLFDEGCIQFVSSMIDGLDVNVLPIQQILDSEFYTDLTILFKCSLERTENIQRLLRRNKVGDRFVTENTGKMKWKLEKKDDLLQEIYSFDWKHISAWEIDTMNQDDAVERCRNVLTKE